MNILIAPNSIKGAANAADISEAVEAGLLKAKPGFNTRKLPIADGGEYTLEVLLGALGGKIIEIDTFDPLGRPIRAAYGITGNNTAIIELPKASGYELLKRSEMNPLYTSTYGTGLQLLNAIEQGCDPIYMTLGGSATVDGGSGIIQALGIKMLDRNGDELPKGGGNLIILDRIEVTDTFRDLYKPEIRILSDVTNTLLGKDGAAMVFAPQKGAGPLETMILERCLARFGEKCEEHSGKNLVNMEGAGAAGGVAVGLGAILDVKIISGTEYILKVLDAEKYLDWADVLITAEGKLDHQTFAGKAPAVLAKKAKEKGMKVICIAGAVPLRSGQPDELFDAVFSIQNRPMTLEESIRNTLENIQNIAFEIGRLVS